MPDLTNQIILVTGANRGQGKSIAEHLASSGAIVVIGARNFADAEETADIIGKDYTFPVQLDVTKESDWQSAVNKIIDQFGRIDVLVNNAGAFERQSFNETTLEVYQELINVNQLGVFMGMSAVISHMEKQQKGSIINNVSISSFAPI